MTAVSSRSSFSSRSSMSSRGTMGLSSGVSIGGFGSSRSGLAMNVMSQRSGSVYGGAGGSGIRISTAGSSGRLSSMAGGYGSGGGGGGGFGGGSGVSYSAFSMDAGGGGDGGFGSVSEKQTMQNLNSRLGQYLETVRTLEEANAKLEEQIRQFGLSRVTVSPLDLSSHQTAIEDVRAKILATGTIVAELALQMDNVKLAAEDFRVKYESELGMRQSVEADVAGLRRIQGEISLAKSDLEFQLDSLKEEQAYLQRNHEEEMLSFKTQMSGQVQVEVDAAPAADLNAVISEIREQYEGMVSKYRRDAEAWFQGKAEVMQQEVSTKTEVLQTSSVELKESQTASRDLEHEIQSLLSMKSSLEANLYETEARYGAMMVGLQGNVTSLESQLTQIRADTERSSQEYQALLDIKVRLEMEIAEYRRLLEGGSTGGETVEVFKTVICESAPVVKSVSTSEANQISSTSSSTSSTTVTKVVTVVTEELVDGEVVSSFTEGANTEHLVQEE
ncbi:keratin, type I cytoskeletal 19-like [Aplochiton taeniatus]